ncbi:F-box associated ubiquitination effector family protein [Arabidopsis thaliana]|nr:F-box associated ubiquitination effector family protein [Arabidopsis thaliana]AEE28889.1 F-box associated ubiquitination effector family protein [Arabidopsis thaliana]|eukprot:NP_172711.1 F-box associated ubiquitination effector family protein [Arabidopsis thaliana]
MESLPHEVVERILEKTCCGFSAEIHGCIETMEIIDRISILPTKTIDTASAIRSREDYFNPDLKHLTTLVLGSSSSVTIPTPWEKDKEKEKEKEKEDEEFFLVSFDSCDGLVCLYKYWKSGYVVNPTTRWYRPLPLSQLQQLLISLGRSVFELGYTVCDIGFGKDKITGTYKPVWLYNSLEIGLENATTCEVFDFNTNAWRYVSPTAPYREETKILSFDLHTETFRVVSKAPFTNVKAFDIVMCNLGNRLCVSEKNWPNQVIWSFNSGNKTWHKMFSINLDVTSHWFGNHIAAVMPLALFYEKKKKKKLLFYCRVRSRTLMVYDPETESYDVAFNDYSIGYPLCYFQSLISIS